MVLARQVDRGRAVLQMSEANQRRSRILWSSFGKSFLFFVCIVVFGAAKAVAEDSVPTSDADLGEQVVGTLPLQERLRVVVDSVDALEARIKEKTKELRAGQALGKEEEVRAELKGLREQRDALRANFSELVSQTDVAGLDQSTEQNELDLDKELRSLLSPVIKELKEFTRRPRELERIRSEIIKSQTRLSRIEKAIENIAATRAQLADKTVLGELERVAAEWEEQRKATSTEIEISRQRLQQKESEKIPLSAAFAELFRLFFKSRGRNLVVALAIALLFWFSAVEGWKRAIRLPVLARRRSLMPMRFLNLLANGGSVFGALLVFAMVLYLFGDWVLLVLTLALMLGILWTSKQALSRFWSQMTMLMNVGAVREGELIILNGLPWLVRSLNVHSQLVNPRLSGGTMRVPLNHLIELRSRPLSPKEKLFPTREGDWVLLSDEVYGQVVLQTPEVVRIELVGGAHKVYPTIAFLSLHPRVLSKGFRINEVFGVDYRHQTVLLSEVLPKLQLFVEDGLRASGYAEAVLRVSVEFLAAAASSLNLVVLCDCAGKLAPAYEQLRRLVQRLCIEACNSHDWTIPFMQMTVHLGDAGGGGDIFYGAQKGGD